MAELANNSEPLLTAAFLCEKLLTEGTVNSVIRIVDTIYLDDNFHEELKKDNAVGAELPLTLFVMFRAGKARGEFLCDVSIRESDDETTKIAQFGLNFMNEAVDNTGLAFHMPVRFRWKGFGLYWYELEMAGRALTKVPLNVQPLSKKPENLGKKKDEHATPPSTQ